MGGGAEGYGSGYAGEEGGQSSQGGMENSQMQDTQNEQAFYESQQHQQAQLLGMLQQTGSQIIRYDDVYYPRTDKRAIVQFQKEVLEILHRIGIKTPNITYSQGPS